MDKRLLLVHAHPDDESIGSGATMAKYAAEGVGVTLVTCTGGEMGEILVPELAHLAADQEDRLAEHRRGELEDAMKVLGVTDHRYLGGFGKYRDSGMKWHDDGYAIPADDIHANAFWAADLAEAARVLGPATVKMAGPAAPLLFEEAKAAGTAGQIVDASPAPDIDWVARLGLLADPADSPPRPTYLKPADATPQQNGQIARL